MTSVTITSFKVNAIFSLVSDLFQIDSSTGQLITRQHLLGFDRDTPYVATITASDHGNPPRSSEVELSIFVSRIDEEGGLPIILYPQRNFDKVLFREVCLFIR